jgi:hypothetical protein
LTKSDLIGALARRERERERDYCSPVKYSLWLEPKYKRKRLTLIEGVPILAWQYRWIVLKHFIKVVQMKRVMKQDAAKKGWEF